MPDTIATVTFAGLAAVPALDADGATADGAPLTLGPAMALPWGVTVQLNWWGDTVDFAPGSIGTDQPARVKFLLDHMSHAMGYGVAFDNAPDGLMATVAIPRAELAEPATARAVRQMGNGVRDALSVGVVIEAADVEPGPERGTDHLTVTAGRLVELSSVLIPRFDDARHGPLAASAPATLPQDRRNGAAGYGDSPSRPGQTAWAADGGAGRGPRLGDLVAAGARLSRGGRPLELDNADDAASSAPGSSSGDDAASSGADDQTDQTDDNPEGDDVPDTATTDTDADDAARVQNHRATTRAGASAPPPRGRFDSFGHYAMAARLGQVDAAYSAAIAAAWSRRELRAALADQLTTDVPGLMPEAWISDVVDIMGQASAVVQAFRQIPLPDSGMVVNLPVVRQHPDVGKVTGEKVAIPTRKMLIDPASYPVGTYAGGQDISIQTLLRSAPSYLDVLMRAFAVEMAVNVDVDVATALAAAVAPTLTLDAADLNGSLIDAAVALLSTSFRFAEVMVLGVDVWAAMGKAIGTDGRPLFPTISPWNPVGTFNVTDGQGNVRGLGYYVDPNYPPDQAVLGIREAWVTMLGPVGTLSSDVPSLLGRDVAVFRFAAFGPTDTRGLVGLTLSGATAASAPASGRTTKQAAS